MIKISRQLSFQGHILRELGLEKLKLAGQTEERKGRLKQVNRLMWLNGRTKRMSDGKKPNVA